MLWLSRRRVAGKFNIFNAPFVINDIIYVLTFSYNTDRLSMYTLHPRSPKLKRIPMQRLHADPHSNEMSILVYNETAYWFGFPDDKIRVGTVESDGFHWRRQSMTGIIPRDNDGRFSDIICLIVEHGVPKIFTIIDEDGMEEQPNMNELALYELNLNTFEWSKRSVVNNQDIYNFFDDYDNDSAKMHDASGKLIISSQSSLRGAHVTFDLSSNSWAFSAKYVKKRPQGCTFVFRDQLHLFGFMRLKNTELEDFGVFRSEESGNEWIKVHSYNFAAGPVLQSMISISIGSMIVFLETKCASPRFLPKCTDICVLETEPTLFDHALAVLMRQENYKELMRSRLPSSLVDQLLPPEEDDSDDEEEDESDSDDSEEDEGEEEEEEHEEGVDDEEEGEDGEQDAHSEEEVDNEEEGEEVDDDVDEEDLKDDEAEDDEERVEEQYGDGPEVKRKRL